MKKYIMEFVAFTTLSITFFSLNLMNDTEDFQATTSDPLEPYRYEYAMMNSKEQAYLYDYCNGATVEERQKTDNVEMCIVALQNK